MFRPAGSIGFILQASPNSYPAALVQITLANTPPDHPVTEAGVKRQLQALVSEYLANSVEER